MTPLTSWKSVTGSLVFEDVEHVERKLEAIDVRNGEFRAFDCDGFPLELRVEKRRLRGVLGGDVEITRVGPRAGASEHREALHALRSWLADNCSELRLEGTESLAVLLRKTADALGYAR